MTDESLRSCWPTPAHELLLQAALWRGPAARQAWSAWKAGVDIDALDPGSQGLLPLVYHNLHTQGVADPLVTWCKGHYRRTWYVNQLALGKLERLVNDLAAAGIERVLLLKGTALELSVYGDPGLRTMGDADILVPWQQAPSALRLLLDWGFTPNLPRPHPHAWDLCNRQGLRVDLHWHALYDAAWPGADDAFWAGAVPQTLGKRTVYLLQTADQLLHVLAHGMAWQYHVAPVRWIADAVTVLRTAAAPIDWDRLVRLTRELKLSLRIRGALEYLRDRWDIAVPHHVFTQLRRMPTSVRDLLHYERRQSSCKPPRRSTRQLWHDYRTHGNGTPRHQVVEFTRYLKGAWGLPTVWHVPIAAGGKLLKKLLTRRPTA